MKVTATIQDELIEEVMAKAKAKNITESLKTALTGNDHFNNIIFLL